MESWHTVSWPLPVASRATNGNAPPATALSDPDRNSWKTSAVFPSKMAIAGSKCANFPQVVPSDIPRMLVTSHQIFPRFRVNSPFVHDFHQDCHWRFSILRQTQTWFKRKSTPILWNHFNKKTKKNGSINLFVDYIMLSPPVYVVKCLVFPIFSRGPATQNQRLPPPCGQLQQHFVELILGLEFTAGGLLSHGSIWQYTGIYG
jgi:hypothetical protein